MLMFCLAMGVNVLPAADGTTFVSIVTGVDIVVELFIMLPLTTDGFLITSGAKSEDTPLEIR